MHNCEIKSVRQHIYAFTTFLLFLSGEQPCILKEIEDITYYDMGNNTLEINYEVWIENEFVLFHRPTYI